MPGNAESCPENPRGRPWVRPVILLSTVAVIYASAWAFDLGARLGQVRLWLEEMGPWGILAFIGLYVAGVVLALPAEIFTILGGSVFGSAKGLFAVLVASPIGAALSFLIARRLAGSQMREWLSRRARLARLDSLTERRGAVLVAVVRLTHILPSSILSYVLGLTRVRFVTYIVVSWLCMLPTAAFYVVASDGVAQLLSDGAVPWPQAVAAAAVAVVVLALLAIAVRRLVVLRTQAPADGDGPGAECQ